MKYWFRLLAWLLSILIGLMLACPFLSGVGLTLALLYAPCGDSGVTPAAFDINAWEDVTLDASAGGRFKGYFLSGENGRAVIIPPAAASGRGNALADAALLHQHGYSVFVFDSRRCAENMGPMSLGYQEVNEVADALTYVSSRPEVDPDQIGIMGFSSAGATAVMAAARFPELRAVVAMGGYGDFFPDTMGTVPSTALEAFIVNSTRIAMPWTYRFVIGSSITTLNPVGVIDEIAPRPILLIYGTEEISLPSGRAQLAAAGDNATLWLVEGAGHGNYQRIAPEAYEQRVVDFFDRALE